MAALDHKQSGQTATHADSGVLEDVQGLWQAVHELGFTHLQLAALATQRAGMSLVAMIVAAMMAAILLVGAWLGLLAAAVLTMVEHGMLASSAVLLVVAANLLMVLICSYVVRRKSRYLQFPALLRSVRPARQTHAKEL